MRRNLVNIAIAGVFIFLLFQEIPSVIEMYGAEGKPAKSALVFDLSGQPIPIPLASKQVLVFWATWCSPCKVELSRINRMIANGEIPAESVLAISVSEDPDLVLSFVKEQKYRFKSAVDRTGQVAALYKISGTPTIILIDEEQKMDWVTMGISPSLEFRLKSFLR